MHEHPPFVNSVEPPFDEAMIADKANQPIPSNSSLQALIPIVKEEVLAMIDLLAQLKLMIQLRIPAVEDGNNFGVEIQEESINEIAKLEDTAFAYIEKINQYHGNRTRVIAKISKYPAVIDYWQGLGELDEAFYTDLRLHLVEMRNQYSTIHDLLLKNEEKIKNPRGESDSGHRRHTAFA